MAVQRDKVIASAEKLVAKGKVEPAIKEYERLLDDNPNDVNTLNRIGDLWVRINRNDEAVKVFGKIADHYSKDGFFLKAIAIYKKINKLDPSKLDVYAKLADLYAKQGLAMEAKSQYQVLADYYLKHGDPNNALGIYRKIAELDPQSINVHVKLADLYSQNNLTAEALKEYDRVGRMLLKRGMLDEAVQVFKKALKIDPKNMEMVDSLVTALLEAKNFDAAQQIVQGALENNRDSARLHAVLGKIHLGKGDAAGARNALERALAMDANDNTARESLAELYLRQGQPDKALEMVAPLAEKALARGERGVAVEMFNRVLKVDAAHTPTLERLVALYTRLNEETNILASMNSLAEAHIGKGQYEQASGVLEKLIQREPQNAQHRTKLQFVRTQMTGVDTQPPRPKAAEPPAAAPAAPPTKAAPTKAAPPPRPVELEIEEPVPTFDFNDEPSMSIDIGTPDLTEVDFQLEEPEEVPRAALPEPSIEMIEEEMPMEVEAPGDDIDFITEHLTEAEVFAKYGLAEKAIEHLRTVIERAPKHLAAYERLYRLLLDEDDVDAARATANTYVSLLTEKGDTAAAALVRDDFSNRGLTLEKAAPKAAPAPPKPAPAPAPKAAAPPPPKPAPKPAAPPPPPPPPVEEPEEEVMDFSSMGSDSGFSIDLETPVDIETPVAEEMPVEFGEAIEFGEDAPSIGFEETPSMSFDEEAPSAGFEEVAASSFEEAMPSSFEEATPTSFDEIGTGDESFFGGAVAEAAEDPDLGELGEIDFYIEQELYEEALQKTDTLLAQYPNSSVLAQRRDFIDNMIVANRPPPTPKKAAPAPAQKSVAPPPQRGTPAPVLSRDEIESELLSAIPDDDDDFGGLPAAAAAASQGKQFAAPTAKETAMFDDEGDFFDLAAELEAELVDEDEPVALAEEEQSLEEIFKEFKKGVEQQLDSEDYDTHYNLGIAYKEMGLVDEAIGEFQLASKDPKRAVECASMLGLCFLEKGMPQLAIKWYRKGLEMPEIAQDEHMGLLYDLGSAYLEVGDTGSAHTAFMEVYAMNTHYRDIATRIKQLEDARS